MTQEGHVDGPPYRTHLWAILVRILLVLTPIFALFFGIVIPMYTRGGMGSDDLVGFSVMIAILAAFPLAVALLFPLVLGSMRAQRFHLLATRTSGSGRGRTLAWSATLLGQRFAGSVNHLAGGIRFLWHAPGQFTPGELVLEVAAEEVAAVETHTAASAREWWSAGSPIVVLLLRDGRQIRIAAWGAEALAQHLRDLLGRAEATPLGPPLALDHASPKEIAAVLARRHPAVALVIQEAGAKAPFVLLHGSNETLAGALALAQEALARERNTLAPYAAGREPPAGESASAS